MVSAIIFGFVVGAMVQRNKVKEIVEYVDRQQVIERMREDYVSRDPVEFFEAMPGVRGAAYGAIDEFERRRDEAVYRFRNRLAD
jgi:hypothetical protein